MDILHTHTHILDFPSGSDSKETACKAGDPGSVPGKGRAPEEGMATHSGILNRMDREAWQATVQGVPKSQTQLSD